MASQTFKAISIDPSIPYGQNLSDAINRYWNAKVATYEGKETEHTYTKVVMSSRHGVPEYMRALNVKHECIVRCRVVLGTKRWEIIDGNSEGTSSSIQHAHRQEDARKALSRRAEIRKRIEEGYRSADQANVRNGTRYVAG